MFFNHFFIAWCETFLNSLNCFQMGLTFGIAEILNRLDHVVVCIDDCIGVCDRWLGDVFVLEEHCVGDAFAFSCFDEDDMASVVLWGGSKVPAVAGMLTECFASCWFYVKLNCTAHGG